METAVAVILTVVIITGAGKKDIQYRQPMPNLKICMEEAERFLNHEFPDSVDAEALFAGCKSPVTKKEETPVNTR